MSDLWLSSTQWKDKSVYNTGESFAGPLLKLLFIFLRVLVEVFLWWIFVLAEVGMNIWHFYRYQNPHEAQLLFGRGFRAGMDRREQKKVMSRSSSTSKNATSATDGLLIKMKVQCLYEIYLILLCYLPSPISFLKHLKVWSSSWVNAQGSTKTCMFCTLTTSYVLALTRARCSECGWHSFSAVWRLTCWYFLPLGS